MSDPELCFLSARELVRRMLAKEVSAREVMAAHMAQVERLNPAVNAVPEGLEGKHEMRGRVLEVLE